MKHCTILILLAFLFGGNMAFAQKNKVKGKGDGDKKEQHVQNPDSNITKAAIRGSANMQAARDSLRGAKIEPTVDVVDTFNVLPQYKTGVSRLRISQIEAGEERIKELKESLERASLQLEAAKKNGTVSPAHAKELEAKIKFDQERVGLADAKMMAIRKEWNLQHNIQEEEQLPEPPAGKGAIKPQPATGTKPAAPPASGSKGSIKGKGQ